MPVRNKRVCSSAWLERTPDKGEVGGSSPPRPTIHLNRSLVLSGTVCLRPIRMRRFRALLTTQRGFQDHHSS